MEETVADRKCMTREDENYIFEQSENISRAVKDEHIEDWRLCLCFLYSLQNNRIGKNRTDFIVS